VQLPFPQPHPLRAGAELRAVRAAGPIHRVRTSVGDEAWLITGYAEVRALLDDDRLGRSHRTPQIAPRSRASALFGGPIGDFEAEFTGHERMRSLLNPHFSARSLHALKPRVEALTTGLLDELELHGPPADLHMQLALPLPVLVICELLGVPYDDRETFQSWVHACAFEKDADKSLQGMAALIDYCTGLVADKRRRPGEDVISRLCEEDGLPDVEIAVLAMALLFAGFETSVVKIWHLIVQLLSERNQWQALLDDPSLIPKATEELMRVTMNANPGIPRYARETFTINGVTIGDGDLVLLDPGSANHDPEFFDSPDVADFRRRGTPPMSFGYGRRYCLGAPLARLELKSVFSQLIPRFPDMRLTVDASELSTNVDDLGSGLGALPVTW
jgi:pentalenolactone synthase